jgi:hypothetical protein
MPEEPQQPDVRIDPDFQSLKLAFGSYSRRQEKITFGDEKVQQSKH